MPATVCARIRHAGQRVEELLQEARARLQRSRTRAHAEQREHGASSSTPAPQSERRAQGVHPGGAGDGVARCSSRRLDPAGERRVADVTDHDVRIVVDLSPGLVRRSPRHPSAYLGLVRATDVIGGSTLAAAELPIGAFSPETYNPSPIDTD